MHDLGLQTEDSNCMLTDWKLDTASTKDLILCGSNWYFSTVLLPLKTFSHTAWHAHMCICVYLCVCVRVSMSKQTRGIYKINFRKHSFIWPLSPKWFHLILKTSWQKRTCYELSSLIPFLFLSPSLPSFCLSFLPDFIFSPKGTTQ